MLGYQVITLPFKSKNIKKHQTSTEVEKCLH